MQPRFDWGLYADATFAGLAILIPIPGVDWLFEFWFRRRIPKGIAARHGLKLRPTARRLLASGPMTLGGCLLLPLRVPIWFLMRTYRTIFYVLTIKGATDNLSYYWHRAFLVDRAITAGHVGGTIAELRLSARAIEQTLEESRTSPMVQLAADVVADVRHVLRTAWRFLRRKREDDVTAQARNRMAKRWAEFADDLERAGERYDRYYRDLSAAAASSSA